MIQPMRTEIVDERVLVLTIDRPEVRNALDPPTSWRMAEVFDDFASDDDLWVAVLTGAGDRAFCAGMDLRVQAGQGLDFSAFPPSGFGGLTHRTDLDKPVIAAVNGLALGGGLELALACDLVVADEGARLGLPEARVGTAAAAGGLVRLPRQIGPKRAAEMVLTGRPVDAETMHRWGLVNRVVPAGTALEAAVALARDVLGCAPLAVRTAKRAMATGLQTSVEDALRSGPADLAALIATTDFEEGARAFVEKRPPVWQAR